MTTASILWGFKCFECEWVVTKEPIVTKGRMDSYISVEDLEDSQWICGNCGTLHRFSDLQNFVNVLLPSYDMGREKEE